MHLRQFAVLDLGLDHYASQHFIYEHLTSMWTLITLLCEPILYVWTSFIACEHNNFAFVNIFHIREHFLHVNIFNICEHFLSMWTCSSHCRGINWSTGCLSCFPSTAWTVVCDKTVGILSIDTTEVLSFTDPTTIIIPLSYFRGGSRGGVAGVATSPNHCPCIARIAGIARIAYYGQYAHCMLHIMGVAR